MIQDDRYFELTVLLWQIVDGKIDRFVMNLGHGERADHLQSTVETFAREHKLRLKASKAYRRPIFRVVKV